MTAGGGVLNVMADLKQARAALSQNATYPADVALARNAIDRSFVVIAELIAADREYDEAREALRKLERDLSASGAAIDAAIDRVESATARRASAIAALEQQS